MEKTEKLIQLLNLLKEGEEYAKTKDIVALFKALSQSTRNIYPTLSRELDRKFSTSVASLSRTEVRIKRIIQDAKDTKDKDFKKAAAAFIREVQQLKRDMEEMPTRDDVIGFVERMMEQITEIKAERIVDLLETLKEDDRLDASAIKNLPEWKEKVERVVATSHALWNLMDVDVAGITAGQSLQWDGIKWVPYSPAGSGGTPVWGEVLETQDPDGTVFTLDNTPVAGSVRLFRGGTYQREGVGGDYSISGDTITLNYALIEGEKLTADYSHA